MQERIELLTRLGDYLESKDDALEEAKERAMLSNPWFTMEQIETALTYNAVLLKKEKLEAWLQPYHLPEKKKTVGIVMAGNIPMVGFHDWLCGVASGHKMHIKLSTKDAVLIKHFSEKLMEWEPALTEKIVFAENLKGCDAYIATGSNNTSRYFEQYFGKYPHIIRRNRTSVAILDGSETEADLQNLARDIFTYYGLGCRNVTQVCVPEGYDFTPLLDACKAYESFIHHHKYKNNYDYHLAIFLLNRVPYLTNESLLLVENKLPFSAVGVLHYRYYEHRKSLEDALQKSEDIQAIIGEGFVPFGEAQQPALTDYADGVDTMEFLCGLN